MEVTELNNTITKLENILEGLNSRLDEANEGIIYQEDREVELTQTEQGKKMIKNK